MIRASGTIRLLSPIRLCNKTYLNTTLTSSKLTNSRRLFFRHKNNMSTVQDLQQEKDRLEQRVHELVDKLESQKKAGDIKVDKNLVIKSKEEQEACEALDKLEIAEKANASSSVKPGAESSSAKPVNPSKGGKQKGASKEPPAPERDIDVSRLDLRIGRILEVSHHPDADALYVEKIDCGDPSGPRTVISGLVKHVPIDEMKDRDVVVLCNLKPAKMRGILSEAMVMCASSAEKVELLQPPVGVKPGDRVIFQNYSGDPDAQLNPKKKIWEQVSPDIKTNDEGIAYYKDSPFKIAGNEGVFKSNLKNVQIR